MGRLRNASCALLAGALLALLAAPAAQAAISCQRTVSANVVAFDKPLMYNRLGASNVNGMMYALRRDVINTDSKLPLTAGGAATPGKLDLRPDRRHRPLVLRVRTGDCLTVNFQNLLTASANPRHVPPNLVTPAGQITNVYIDEQIADRAASFHAIGHAAGR